MYLHSGLSSSQDPQRRRVCLKSYRWNFTEMRPTFRSAPSLVIALQHNLLSFFRKGEPLSTQPIFPGQAPPSLCLPEPAPSHVKHQRARWDQDSAYWAVIDSKVFREVLPSQVPAALVPNVPSLTQSNSGKERQRHKFPDFQAGHFYSSP